MRVSERDIERRAVIEAYAKYDCLKKGHSTPEFATWDWSQADAIDREMQRAKLKTGVPAGYLLWDKVEVTILDLRECAVDGQIFPGQPRKLGLVGGLVDWEPKLFQYLAKAGRPVPLWYDKIKKGDILDETDPLMIRPALSSEPLASWYIEDGSGRAITFVANQNLFNPSQPSAIGYLGRQPDLRSSFMQRAPFRELLQQINRGRRDIV